MLVWGIFLAVSSRVTCHKSDILTGDKLNGSLPYLPKSKVPIDANDQSPQNQTKDIIALSLKIKTLAVLCPPCMIYTED